ncbi:aminotransferase class I/II-fold pyridoxal phosphate-dependent enzyme [Hymenobacter sp. BT175]|uniref:pyridoxal phosphate-dependent aminotransferase n=1 Tax=Hymenobacter translucens TaxID=2886507 RepID=UPI001D0DD07C|nr:aminotransferase class I/II-fold pyridoxal phosphate-dependent enzyme [Hymenobacter translucens]MCC2546686.1 aminotransferase class I/II-fold pyridoxal phosphate-dependent enzyme [Hymenobacter translucens]
MSLSPISLASGYVPFPAPAVATEAAVAAVQAGPLPVLPAAGLPALREALAGRFRQQGATVEAGQVIVTPGAKPALYALLLAVLQPGDEVLLLTPNWFGFAELVARAGGTLRSLPLSAADGYALHPEAIATALTPRTRLLLYSNPNNPTGRLYTRAELDGLVAVTRQHPGLLVLADEIYDLMVFSDERVPSLLEWPDPHGQHLVVNGFSKSLGLVGWGIGYLIAPPELARACAAWQHATGSAVPAPIQQAALAATLAAPAVAGEILERLAETRELMLQELNSIPGVRYVLPTGTYYVFADLTAYLSPNPAPADAAALVGRLREGGVEVVDGSGCDAPGFVRLSYAVPAADLREALGRLRATLTGSAARP